MARGTGALHDFAGSTALRYARPMRVAKNRYDYGPGTGILPVRTTSVQKSNPQAGATALRTGENRLDVIGQPSFKIYQKGSTGNTVMSVRRETEYMKFIEPGDLQQIRNLALNMYNMLRAYSMGPYDQKALNRMGNPYGYDTKITKSGKPIKVRRGVPRMHGGKVIGAVKNVKGSVPTLSVINKQSGDFLENWRWSVLNDARGITLNFWNTSTYAWYLAAGTHKMQAHGPWTEIVMRYMNQVNNEFLRVVSHAQHRARLEESVAKMFERKEQDG